MSNLQYRHIPVLLLAALLAACTGDAVTPDAGGRSPETPQLLLAPGESFRTIADSTDAAGNLVMVNEYAAGIYTQPDGVSGSVASVTVKTVVPATSGTSGTCITSTIVGIETTPGWTATVKKPGGCDKEIVVALANAATGQRADFRYLYIAGKTRIDQGAVS
jgi:hypothetical protein